jgi:ATP-dependent protease ClpP protease subunit
VNVKDRRRVLRARIRPGQSWYKISNSAGVDGPAEIAIYDEIGWLGITADAFLSELREITASEINLHINSPGGEIFDGIAIHNVLRSHAARITVYVDSLAASIASVIAMAGDRVIMQPHSQFMIHDGSGLCVGNAADMREMADLLDRQSDNIAAVYAERAGGTVRQWRQRMRDETWYSAAEAVEAGLADEVARLPRRDDGDMSNDWDLSVFRYAGRSAAPAPSDAAPAAPPEAADAGGDAPAPEDQAPVPEPFAPESAAPLSAGEGPAPEPLPVPPLDGDLFRAAVERAAGVVPFDADEFRATMATLAADAPAVPPPAPVAEPDPEPEPVPEPEPEPGPGEVLAETVALLAADAPAVPAARAPEPAPEPPEPEPPPAPEPAPDPWAEMAQIFRAGVELASANAPAPRSPAPDPGPEPEPYDPVLVQRALKEAMK